MKTKTFYLLLLVFCISGTIAAEAQGLYNIATLDEELERLGQFTDDWVRDVYGNNSDFIDSGVEWADNTLGGSAGFGWSDSDGNSDTSFCFGAEFLHRITGERQNPNGAGYLGISANYHNANSDNFKESLFRVGPKYAYFNRFSTLNKVQLVYGANAFYETGSRDFSGFEEDVTGYGASLFAGANFRLCEKVSVGVEIPVISYLSRTFESGGNEFDTDNIWLGVNKDNSVSATLRWVLDNLDDDEL